MKSFQQYILEAQNNNIRLNSVTVTYECSPMNDDKRNDIIIQAPDSYQEADIQQYINDLLLNSLPSSQDYATKFFGVNDENIFDIYFEYDKFEHLDNEDKSEYDIEWNNDYSKSGKAEELGKFKLTNLKYIIKFDRFDMEGIKDDNKISSYLQEIFNVTVSNSSNQYPIFIKNPQVSFEK